MSRLLKIGFLGLLLFGCRSSKEFYSNTGTLKNITDAKLIKNTEENYVPFNSVFFKKFHAEIVLNGDKKSFRGNMFIERDHSIVVSIYTLMNIELVRVRFQPDLVEIMDRTKKEYTKSDYRLLWKKFMVELDYHMLQDILLNELYAYPIGDNIRLDLKKYKHDRKANMYTFQSIKKGRFSRLYRKESTDGIILHEFSILPEVFKVSKSYIKDFGSNTSVNIEYDNFTQIQSSLMPNKIMINGNRDGDCFSLNIYFPTIDITGNNSIGFKVSKKYDVKDLLHE
ncbi:MAG: DUF4292 domain-containing protein [Marinilabiliaceae bacterium]|nr:DUF4292 domain-containing protein [Marinilabiliaceae bacterium]